MDGNRPVYCLAGHAKAKVIKTPQLSRDFRCVVTDQRSFLTRPHLQPPSPDDPRIIHGTCPQSHLWKALVTPVVSR